VGFTTLLKHAGARGEMRMFAPCAITLARAPGLCDISAPRAEPAHRFWIRSCHD